MSNVQQGKKLNSDLQCPFFIQIQVFDYFLKEINRNTMGNQWELKLFEQPLKKEDIINPSGAFCLATRLTSQLSRQSLVFNDFRCPGK